MTPPPTPNQAVLAEGEIAGVGRRLSQDECQLISAMLCEDEHEYPFFGFARLAGQSGLPKERAVAAVRSLALRGYATFAKGLWNDDGPAGSGYALTVTGRLVRDHDADVLRALTEVRSS